MNTDASDHTLTAIITDIERFTVHDGTGIRTLVFVKGCPLRCQWCSNPETQLPAPQIAQTTARCLGCQTCLPLCEAGALTFTPDGIQLDRDRCTLCGECVEACVAESLVIIGQRMTPDAVFAEINKDAIFYETSGGGVTLSGGEPLTAPAFARALLARCKAAGFNTAVETCGHVSWESFAAVLPYVDLFLYDVKHMDETQHQQGTGVSNTRILANLARLDEAGVDIIVRVPLIPGFNESVDNIRRTAALAAGMKHVRRLDLLPYHRLGTPKYRKLGLNYPLDGLTPPQRSDVERLLAEVQAYGLAATIGG